MITLQTTMHEREYFRHAGRSTRLGEWGVGNGERRLKDAESAPNREWANLSWNLCTHAGTRGAVPRVACVCFGNKILSLFMSYPQAKTPKGHTPHAAKKEQKDTAFRHLHVHADTSCA